MANIDLANLMNTKLDKAGEEHLTSSNNLLLQVGNALKSLPADKVAKAGDVVFPSEFSKRISSVSTLFGNLLYSTESGYFDGSIGSNIQKNSNAGYSRARIYVNGLSKISFNIEVSSNFSFVTDENEKIIGKLSSYAEGSKIYSLPQNAVYVFVSKGQPVSDSSNWVSLAGESAVNATVVDYPFGKVVKTSFDNFVDERIDKEIKEIFNSVATLEKNKTYTKINGYGNASTHFVGFGSAILPKKINNIIAHYNSVNAGIAICEITDKNGNVISTKTTSVVEGINEAKFEFNIDCSSEDYVIVRFYSNNGATPKRGLIVANTSFIASISKPYFYRNAGGSWTDINDPNYSIPFVVESLELENISNTKNEIVVDINGFGDFTSFSAAVKSITDSSSIKPYTIYVKEGTYDIMEEMGGAEWYSSITTTDTRKGLFIPDNVSIIGVGDRDKIILKGWIPDEYATLENTTSIATIELYQNSEIKNVTISSKNQRYVIHDESGNVTKNFVHRLENVVLEHNGNKSGTWSSFYTYGAGSGSGSKYIFEKCVFRGIAPWSMHSNANQDPVDVIFNGCSFESSTQDGIRFSSYGNTTVMNHAYINNCSISGSVITSNGNLWEVKISGSSNIPTVAEDNTDGIFRIINIDNTRMLKNDSGFKIVAGTCVRLGLGYKMVATSNKNDFYGVLLNDVENGSSGYVVTKGFCPPIGVTSAVDGNLIGIQNNKLFITTDRNSAIGVACGGYGYKLNIRFF